MESQLGQVQLASAGRVVQSWEALLQSCDLSVAFGFVFGREGASEEGDWKEEMRLGTFLHLLHRREKRFFFLPSLWVLAIFNQSFFYF